MNTTVFPLRYDSRRAAHWPATVRRFPKTARSSSQGPQGPADCKSVRHSVCSNPDKILALFCPFRCCMSRWCAKNLVNAYKIPRRHPSLHRQSRSDCSHLSDDQALFPGSDVQSPPPLGTSVACPCGLSSSYALPANALASLYTMSSHLATEHRHFSVQPRLWWMHHQA